MAPQQPWYLWLVLLLSVSSPTPSALPHKPEGRSPPGEDRRCEGHRTDVCGVCAGNGSSCTFVSGTFSRSFLSVGYHKFLEIPAGAQRIKVEETPKSRNYLAIRTSTGDSVINGKWAIDRPGVFLAAGTQLAYRRPNEIRSKLGELITAPGPISEDLHVFIIYQQPNPSVHYEYVLPGEDDVLSPQEVPHSDNLPVEPPGLNPVDEQSFVPPDTNEKEIHPNQVPSEAVSPTGDGSDGQLHPDPLPPYGWRPIGTTTCSATCGTGRRQVVFGCVEQPTQTAVPADFCESAQDPASQEEECNLQPCPTFWDVGEWSECSKTCGPGLQHRQVLCRERFGNLSAASVAPRHCGHLDQPETVVSCQLKICSEWQVRSEWTSCSVPCGVGQRTRDVRCVDNLGDVVVDEECNMNLRPDDVQNCDTGPCTRSWFFSPWSERCSTECGEGSRSRSVVCLTNHISSLPLDSCGDERPEERTSCHMGPCQNKPEWYTGPWGQCSAECGDGMQSRHVVCLLHGDSGLEVTASSNCSHLPRPPASQPCRLKKCGPAWYVTEWSACSRSCEGGYRVREVRCLGDDMNPSEGCDPSIVPEDREPCNEQPCTPEIDMNCQDLYYNCNVVVQARLCVYAYYRTACCASCRRLRLRESRRTGR
ncbi:LOW QUALITY PROTEIN: thrombospondin type-1 domain-containing protein 4 [Paramormyrops kingsleyae]|uniref:LOW QUALITY PROTEIN: thrombospondin type-1 domain-containing protein 4 n=1 Tax=Paramormyrops kingsleyae TaxID=1676925 RepID=UPI003B96BF1D